MIDIAEIKLSDSEIAAAVAVLKSGDLRQGRQCKAFEAEFAEKVGAKQAIASANGTAALHLAYMAFLEPGDEVLVPSFTFFATASTVALSGGVPVICDVDPETFLLDLDDATRRISPRTRVIAPVHLFGNACDADRVSAFARKHNLLTVWDAAQAHGATFKGCDVGSFGDVVAYSFYPSKNMFVGEGGMTCTDNGDLAEKMRFLRTHGQTNKYYHTMLGLNYRMTDVEAAIGREQLKRLDDMLAVRRRNADLLNETVGKIRGLRPQRVTEGCSHAWHQYCVLVDPDEFGCDRDALGAYLRECGVATGVHYPRGLHQQPIFETLYGRQEMPNTEYLAQRILALPVHHGLSVQDVETIARSVQKAQDTTRLSSAAS